MIKRYLLSIALVLSFGIAALSPALPVGATAISQTCIDNPDALICKGTNDENAVKKLIGTIVDLLLFGIGALSVVMIIFSGIRYSTSMGDANNITKAKNSLMYAVIGLVVALLAYPTVHWLIGVLIKD